MESDMTKYASLLKDAKIQQDSGDLKSAYATYVEAHGIILRILGTQVVFKNQDTVVSSPANYTQLFAHAQEILRRIKDIMDQAKTPTIAITKLPSRTVSSNSVASKQSRPNASPLQSTQGRSGLASSRISQRSVATTSPLNKRTKKNIPMIPISPLTRQYLLNSYALSQATQKFEQAKQGSSSGSHGLATLRRLTEDKRIQQTKVDAINVQIQSVAASTITSWDPDMIARQLTIIDTQLFKEIAIPKDLVRADRKSSPSQRCIDFEIYIVHSVAHLLLMDWNTHRNSSTNGSPAPAKGHTPIHTNAVVHMIKVANILLNVYRNFNSFMAIMKALTSPEIKRMHKSWSGVNSKTKESFKRLVSIYRAQDNVQCYKDTLMQKLDSFQDVGKGALIAIPWMRYHMDEVKSIINSYLTGQESTGGSSDIVLSAPGARKLSAVSALLNQCRTNGSSSFDRQDMDDKSSKFHNGNTKHREPVQIDGMKLPLTPILDLASLGNGDITLHHWLLSRPFLNKQQLIDESLEIEPLFNGEELPCYETPLNNEDSDESTSLSGDNVQNDSFEHVVAPEHDLEPLVPKPSRPALPRAPVSETEINDIMSELLNDDSNDSKGLFDDLSSDDDGSASFSKIGDKQDNSGSPGRSQDVLQFLGINPNDHSDSDQEDGGGDFFQKLTTVDKGKGKAKDLQGGNDDTDEINNLLAQVKGLVHESKNHIEELESVDTLANQDLKGEEESDIDEPQDNEDRVFSTGRKFEPFQQGSEEDQFNFDDDQPSVKLSTTTGPATSSLLSLESLRRQLQSVGQLSEPVEDQRKTASDSSTLPGKDEPAQKTQQEKNSAELFNENTLDRTTLSHVDKDELADLSAAKLNALPSNTILVSASASSSSPFMTYMATRSAESLSTSPSSSSSSLLSISPNFIGKGRRRKIHTDRSSQSENAGEKTQDVQTTTGFSPPTRPLLTTCSSKSSLVLDESDAHPDAIASRAKESLVNHEEMKNVATSAKPVVEQSDLNPISLDQNENEASSNEHNESDSNSNILEQKVSIQDPAEAHNSEVEVNNKDSDKKPFGLGASLLKPERNEQAGAEEDQESLLQSTSLPLSIDGPEEGKQDNPTKVKEGEEGPANLRLAGEDNPGITADKSPGGGESNDNRTKRSRRRIAGGVISVAGPAGSASSLISKASNASLSSAFKEGTSSNHSSSSADIDTTASVPRSNKAKRDQEHGQNAEDDNALEKKVAEAKTISNGVDHVSETLLGSVDINIVASNEKDDKDGKDRD
ncbi:hypothetical protein BX616_009699 [Lobosporangium transversale]|uniref:Ras-GEF domain-containing protein n=1 Tax=Lobosporangium transversale TaxID=64571 RepID=A0A1Y2G5K5_9FUNG|nr:hypothetical protein BCR41DRAFT_390807 [Lobosporangium transversale]KAF9913722.1 hypothetical protein BX616_009699 [Lobosporangium transversale]ORY95177.1 hypothetical protein BCR41DRAFT_390807 [Lobosporangium transversale]|eukprot:XP_021875381.1 hypothetical protein BCR41DRAFT_390807 [Lobosporangium transversale]